jgi:hypothetical protein
MRVGGFGRMGDWEKSVGEAWEGEVMGFVQSLDGEKVMSNDWKRWISFLCLD